MKSSGAKYTEQTAWILARSPVLSISIHEWNPLSSPFHSFRSCITVEGNSMDGNPLYLVFRVATAERNTPLHHVFFLCKRKTLRHREIRENGSPVLTSQPTIPSFPTMRGFCIEPEVKFHVFVGLERGEEKLIGNLFFRFSYENNMKIWSSK